MIVSKYKLFILLLLVGSLLPTLPDFYMLATFHKAPGEIISFNDYQNGGKYRAYETRIAVATFHIPCCQLNAFSSLYDGYFYKIGEPVTILYHPHDPTDNHFMTLMGIFGDDLTYLVPYWLILIAIFFGPGILSKEVRVPKWAGKLFFLKHHEQVFD